MSKRGRELEDADDVMRAELSPHPDTPCAALRALSAELRREGQSLWVTYRIEGDIGRLALPARAPGARTDGLWKRTCLEAFVRAPGGEAYWEFNFSPSGQWAAYRFDSYRHGMIEAEVDLAIEAAQTPDVFSLGVRMTAPWLPPRIVVALTAVIEETNGAKSYWALSHPPGAPDFHHADGFVLELP